MVVWLALVFSHAVDDEGVDGEEASSMLIAQDGRGWRAEHAVKDSFGFFPEVLGSIAFLSGLENFGMELVQQLDRGRTFEIEFEDQSDDFRGEDSI